MLQTIRDYTHGWIAGIIISLLILSFALWGIHSYLITATNNDNVAKVNGVEISKSALAESYERLRRQMQTQYAGNQLPMSEEASLKRRSLNSLIEIQVLKQASEQADFRITQDQVDNFLQGIPEFQVNGEFSFNRFQQVLAATLFNPGEFLEVLKTALLIDQPRLGMIFSSFALPNEIDNSISLVEQMRDIQYLTIPQDLFAKQPVMISDEAIAAYYKQHQDDFKTPEQVSIDYIVLSTSDLANTIHPTDSALKNSYNENSNQFALPAQWQIDEIILPLMPTATDDDVKQALTKMTELAKLANSGKSFAEMIKTSSVTAGDDKLKKSLALEQFPTELQKTISGLTKVGQVSEPLRTNKGFVLLKVLSYKEAAVQPFETVKNKVSEVYAHQQAEVEFGDLREKLASSTYEHPESLATAAKVLNLPIQTSSLFTKDKGGKDITNHEKVRETAFSNDVLNLQNNSDVIQLNSDTLVVLRVKNHVPAALLSLEAVKKQIEGKLAANAIEEKLQQFASTTTAALNAGQLTLDQAKAKYNLVETNVGFTGRHASKIDQAILDTAFAMPKPQTNQTTFDFSKSANGYAIVALTALKEPNLATNSKDQYQAYADQIQGSQGGLEYELYKKSLMTNAKIVLENQ